MNKITLLFRMYVIAVAMVLFIPMAYIITLSFHPNPNPVQILPETFSTEHYSRLLQDSGALTAIRNSVITSSVTAGAATVLGILGAKGYQEVSESKRPTLLAIYLLPNFVPGIVLGLSLLAYFRLLGIRTGLFTTVIALLLWCFPFAVLVIIVSMSNLEDSVINASYDLGGSRLHTFFKVELPLIFPGVLGAFLFSFLLSMNEYIRMAFVSGPSYTLPLLMYSHMQGGTIPPQLLAASTIFTAVTIVFMIGYIVYLKKKDEA